MNQLLTRLFKKLRSQQKVRARSLRSRVDGIRKQLRGTWDSAEVIRAIRDGR